MTSLRIQRLNIPDCESAVERSYFDWGRGWAEDALDPDWDGASPEVRQHIMLRGYAAYDGWWISPRLLPNHSGYVLLDSKDVGLQIGQVLLNDLPGSAELYAEVLVG